MNISFKAKVILNKNIKTFDSQTRQYVEQQAKPILEKSFDDDLTFYLSRQKIKGPIINGRQTNGALAKEITIGISKRTFLGFIKNLSNPIKVTTHFKHKTDKNLFNTLSSAIKALTDSNRYKYTTEEVLKTATIAYNKLYNKKD